MRGVDERFSELVRIVATLRSEGGCEWDRAQTEKSMRPFILEESYEVLDAIDRGDDADLAKELGDVLFQVVLVARMAEERGAFDLEDVIGGLNQKMIRRHPHVYDPTHKGGGGGLAGWESRKASERAVGSSALDGVPRALPGLLRAHRVSEKAAAVGFDWPDYAGVRAKLKEEIQELDEAVEGGDSAGITEELGDVLFTLVNLGRHLPTGAEESLREATDRFIARFREVEVRLSAHGARVQDTDPETLEATWRAAKRR